jgi:trans-2,3-dihydro-3-hydroxyanthranilate isomerase
VRVYHYDAFSTEPNKGNPAGVVIDADDLTEIQMQEIATTVGFNETAFICHSNSADVQIRYFTPGHEMDLCGHGTVASLIALYEQKSRFDIKTIETKAGVIEARIQAKDSNITVTMKQLPAEFIIFEGSVQKLASVLGVNKQEIDVNLPIVYGSTGIWTLLVPIKKLKSFKKMSPNTKTFPEVLTQFSHASIHPFCLEVINPKAQMHGRHFSSPFSGTIEDPVTGTASGVMAAYHLNFISNIRSDSVIIEQGQEIGRNGLVTVNVLKSNEHILVEIEGTGVFVKEMMLTL